MPTSTASTDSITSTRIFTTEQETEFLLRAFRRDFEVNGPSVVRIVRTVLRGWKRYKNHPNPRIRERFAYEASNLPARYAGVLWAAREYFRGDPHRYRLISDVLDELHDEFGPRSQRAATITGRRLYRELMQEEARLASGWTYEPPCYYETNAGVECDSSTRVQGILPSAAVTPGSLPCAEHGVRS